MKKVLSLLVAFVFLQTQSWALSGGPVYPGGDLTTYTGTYAGVLIPQTAQNAAAVANPPASAIGLFTFKQPTTGFATGTLVTFVNGAAFNGTIQGVLDPQQGQFNGVLDATSSFQVVVLVPNGQGGFTSQSYTVQASGSMDATVEIGLGSAGTSGASRIHGSAALDVFFSILANGTPDVTQTVRFEVDGYKQSDT